MPTDVVYLGVLIPALAVLAAGGLLVVGARLVRWLRLPTDAPWTLQFEIHAPELRTPADASEASSVARARSTRQRLLTLCRIIHERADTLAGGAAQCDHLPEAARDALRSAAQQASAARESAQAWLDALRTGRAKLPSEADVHDAHARAESAWTAGETAWNSAPDPSAARRWKWVVMLIIVVALALLMHWFKQP